LVDPEVLRLAVLKIESSYMTGDAKKRLAKLGDGYPYFKKLVVVVVVVAAALVDESGLLENGKFWEIACVNVVKVLLMKSN
jgi:hypothetical protein